MWSGNNCAVGTFARSCDTVTAVLKPRSLTNELVRGGTRLQCKMMCSGQSLLRSCDAGPNGDRADRADVRLNQY